MSLTTSKLETHNRRASAPGNLQGSPSGAFDGRSPSTHTDSDAISNGGNASFVSQQASVNLSSPRLSASGVSGRARSAQNDAAPAGSGEAVKVVCRVRPFARRELEIQEEMNAKFANDWEKQPLRSVVDMIDGRVTNFLDHEKGYTVRQSFNFDHSLWSILPEQQDSKCPVATQETVFDLVGRPAVTNVWSGYNTCVFAYGQTGSGKTYTMMGTEDEPGLIPRICRELFEEMERKTAAEEPEEGIVREYRLEGRFLEIYNEKVKDLLWGLREPTEGTEVDRENLKIRLVPGSGPQVIGLTTVAVTSSQDCIDLIEEGTRNRSVAATKMNEQSSRSHSIFRLTLTQTTTVLPQKQFEKPKHYHRTSVVSLVDLAGSERNKKTGAEGERLKEAVAINKSLTTLKNVIDALVEGRAVVPYRDSTLTWLLSDNLGGNSRTFMIACVSPHLDNAEESLNTLRYAIRTQQVVTHASVNESDELRRMARMKNEMERMKAQLLDTGEDALKARSEELSVSVETKRAEMHRQLQLVDLLNEALENAKELQFNAAYIHRFKEVFHKRVEDKFRAAINQLTSEVSSWEIENGVARRDLTKLKSEVDTATIEEDVSRRRRDTLAAEFEQLTAKGANLEQRKNELLKEDSDNSDCIERKAPFTAVAQNLAKVLCAYQLHRSTKEVDRTAVRLNDAIDARRAAEAEATAKTKASAEKKVTDAQAEQDRLIAAIREAKDEQKRITAELAEKNARLHSKCIFFENENRVVSTHSDADILALNKAQLTRQHKEEESWRRLIDQSKIKAETKFDKDREEYKNREGVLRSDCEAECAKIKDAATKTIARIKNDAAVRTSNNEADSARLLDLIRVLNVDSTAFLREADEGEPRYLPLLSTLTTFMANAKNKKLPADATAAVARMNAVAVEKRRTTTPLAFRAEGDDGHSVRSRSIATSYAGDTSTTPGRSQSRATHDDAPSPAPTRTRPDTSLNLSAVSSIGRTTPAATGGVVSSALDKLHHGLRLPAAQIGEIKSLKAPTKTCAQPTRTSLLRCGIQNYMKAPTSAAALAQAQKPRAVNHSEPQSGASTPRRATTPTRARGTSPSPAATPRRQASPSPSVARRAPDSSTADQPVAIHLTDPATRVVAPIDASGSRPRVIRTSDDVVIFSRSRSPAVTRAPPSTTAPAAGRSTTPRRSGTAWR